MAPAPTPLTHSCASPVANSHATAALIPDFKPFSRSLPLNRSDSRRQGRWMWLLLM